MHFGYFVISSIGIKGCGPSFEQTWIPFTQVWIVPSLVEIVLVVLEKKIFKSCPFLLFHYFPIISTKEKMW